MQEHYMFVIGSGFSVPAGLKTGRQLNDCIKNAGDLPIAYHTNGALVPGPDGKTKPDFGFPTSYDETFDFCLRLMEKYCDTHDFDYEEFYDYFMELNRRANLKEQGKELQDLYPLLPSSGYYSINREESKRGLLLHIQLGGLSHIYQELVNYLLILPKQVDYTKYEGWCAYIRSLVEQGSIVDIYSLNHDTLIEDLMKHYGLSEYMCDGYSLEGSPFYGRAKGEQVALAYYANRYDKPIRLHKLHGSMSYYAFYRETEPGQLKVENMIKRPWGLEDFDLYYKEQDGMQKVKKARGMLGFEADFLTGSKEKVHRYESPIYYKPQFENFELDLAVAKQVIAIGYGFRDYKVDEIVEKNLRRDARCAVVDPFPREEAVAEAQRILAQPEFMVKSIDEVEWKEIEEL